jgi:hypothetical protein
MLWVTAVPGAHVDAVIAAVDGQVVHVFSARAAGQAGQDAGETADGADVAHYDLLDGPSSKPTRASGVLPDCDRALG